MNTRCRVDFNHSRLLESSFLKTFLRLTDLPQEAVVVDKRLSKSTFG